MEIYCYRVELPPVSNIKALKVNIRGSVVHLYIVPHDRGRVPYARRFGLGAGHEQRGADELWLAGRYRRLRK